MEIEKSDEKIERITVSNLKCDICLEIKLSPVALPCGHSFCGTPRDCLEGLFIPAGYPRCAICRKLFKVTRDQLKPLYGLREFFEEVNEVHASRKKENPIEKDSNKNYCRKHEDQELEFFCYECCREICGLCWDSDHGDVKSHLVQRIDYAKQRILVNILENVNIETRTQEVHDRIASVQGTILLLEDLMRSMTREYTSLVQELITCEDVAKLDEKERDIMLSQSKFDAENELQKQIIGLRKSITDSRISEKEKAISYEVWTRIAKLDGEVIEDNKSTSMKPTQKLSGYFNNMMQKVKSSLTDNQNTSTPLGGEDMLPL